MNQQYGLLFPKPSFFYRLGCVTKSGTYTTIDTKFQEGNLAFDNRFEPINLVNMHYPPDSVGALDIIVMKCSLVYQSKVNEELALDENSSARFVVVKKENTHTPGNVAKPIVTITYHDNQSIRSIKDEILQNIQKRKPTENRKPIPKAFTINYAVYRVLYEGVAELSITSPTLVDMYEYIPDPEMPYIVRSKQIYPPKEFKPLSESVRRVRTPRKIQKQRAGEPDLFTPLEEIVPRLDSSRDTGIVISSKWDDEVPF